MNIPSLDAVAVTKEFDPLNEDVGSMGSTTAPIALVGEAPGRDEIREGKPFVGTAGRELDRILSSISLTRGRDLYITNAVKTRLPNDDSTVIWNHKGWRCEQFQELRSRLIKELASTSAKVIVPMGATAWLMLSGNNHEISKYRGSPYWAEELGIEELRGRIIMPTFHPASALLGRNPINFWIIMSDLVKAKRLFNEGISRKEYQIKLWPTLIEIKDFLAAIEDETTVDIEAYPGDPVQITCIGFTSKDSVMCIPIVGPTGSVWNETEETEIWRAVADVLENPSIKKSGQNFIFDIETLLYSLGIKTDNFAFDTMLAQHIAWTELPKGLDFITSCYTDYIYYKDDGKEWRHIKDWDSFYRYNAMDCIATKEAIGPLQRELETIGGTNTFEWIMKLHRPLLEMMWRGLKLDLELIAKKKTELQEEVASLEKELRSLIDVKLAYVISKAPDTEKAKVAEKYIGGRFNPGSPAQLKWYFYDLLGHKPYHALKTKAVSCDEKALIRLGRKGVAEAPLIIKIRKAKKLISTYFECSLDSDQRLRCQYKPSGTDTGRLASAKNFRGTGMNLQNQPKAFKSCIIADPGMLLIEGDLARAESYPVAYLSRDPAMIQSLESGLDVHKYNASLIFGVPYEEVTPEQRSMGKKVVHASNYAMGPNTFAINADIEVSEARRLLTLYHARFTGLHRWHREIRDQVSKTRMLVSLLGRPRRVLGPLTDDTFRSCYAFGPQSVVGEVTNRGLTKITNDPRLEKFELLVTVHDSTIGQMPIAPAETVLATLKAIAENLDHEFTAYGKTFRIPVDFKIGLAWGDLIEVKLTIDSVTAALKELGYAAA
jgi:uracil-DNA glycosylase family 4